MNAEPLALSGMLIYEDGRGQQAAGSCFALWRNDMAVTAAHCLLTLNVERWRVAWHGKPSRPVVGIDVHDKADLAVLHLPPAGPSNAPPYELGTTPTVGQTCAAFGYAWDLAAPDGLEPGHKTLSGRVVATGPFTEFEPEAEYDFPCVRLRFPSYAGFSGGPLFDPASPTVALGVNHGSKSWQSHRYLAPTDPEPQHTAHGVDHCALILADYADWLKTVGREERDRQIEWDWDERLIEPDSG
jgi:hypothetical protein